MKFKHKRVLVYGLGDSGRAVIQILRKHDAFVSFYDDNLKYYEYVGFERRPQGKNYDLIVVSPGVKCLGNELLEHFKSKNIPIISEIDFAYMLCKGKIIAITGTNGKTTTCMLTNKILKNAGFKTFLCGNIGLPFSAICEKTTKNSVVVCEISSFQLEMSCLFRSNIACILNIKPDHLDRHKDFEEYKNIKGKIAKKLKKNDILLLNFDDEEAKKMILHKKYRYFSKNKLKNGVYVYQNQIYVNKRPILSINDIHLKGEKNLENVLASVSICSFFKIKPEYYVSALNEFVPASHRMELVGTVNGVTFVDDSKATNISSTIACVEAYNDKSIILLMGGLGKNINYDDFFSLGFKIKIVICFGQDGKTIEISAKKYNYFAIYFEKFDNAVLYAKNESEENDFVLLSPACASFDEFSSYAERGERFKNLIFEEKYEN